MLKEMQEKLQNRFARTMFAVIAAIAVFFPVNGQTPDENFLAGCAYFKTGQNAKAIERFTLAISRNNANEQLFIKRGEVFLVLKDFESAIKDFNEADLIYPGVSNLWLARTCALSGDTEKAISHLKNHLESEFRLPEDSIKKDPAFDGIQTTTQWYTLWEKEWYNSEEKAAAEVNYYNKKKLYDEAISFLNNEIARNPTSHLLVSLRGKVYFNQGNYAAAIADYTASLNMDKKNAGAKTGYPAGKAGAGGGFAARGLAYLKAERNKDAINDFSKAIKDNPENFDLYLQRAEAYAGLQSWEPAIKDVQLYLKYFENDQHALYRCGEFYYGSEDYMNALKFFNRNLKDDPNNSIYYKARGKTYLKTSTYHYAINDLSMSLDLNPEDAETWMYLGIAKIQSGDKENGCSDLEKAQRMGNAEALKYIVESCR
jgi:tetratricopeptide (TPR) repeat protein